MKMVHMMTAVSFGAVLCLLAGSNPAMAQTTNSAPATPERRARPTPPKRDPHTPGFVAAKELPDDTVPPADAEGNFILGPTHQPAPEMAVQTNVLHGAVYEFPRGGGTGKIYPGVVPEPATFGTPDPADPGKLVVTTSHPAAYTRHVAVYVPQQYVAGTAAPFKIGRASCRERV